MVVCREVVGHQRCAGWLQGLSFLVMCWEVGGGIGAALDVGGVSFLRFVVRGLGDRGCFG